MKAEREAKVAEMNRKAEEAGNRLRGLRFQLKNEKDEDRIAELKAEILAEEVEAKLMPILKAYEARILAEDEAAAKRDEKYRKDTDDHWQKLEGLVRTKDDRL